MSDEKKLECDLVHSTSAPLTSQLKLEYKQPGIMLHTGLMFDLTHSCSRLHIKELEVCVFKCKLEDSNIDGLVN